MIIKIAILVLIATLIIGLTIYYVRRESKNKRTYMILGGIAITAGVLVFLFAFPSYIFISWNKVLVEAGILMILFGFCSGPTLKRTDSWFMFFITAISFCFGIVIVFITPVAPFSGTATIVSEDTDTNKITPTVDLVHYDVSIGYSGNDTYFYYYIKDDTVYTDTISDDYKIYHLSADENSYILKSTNTVSYIYSEKKEQKPIVEVTETYKLFVNLEQLVKIYESE